MDRQDHYDTPSYGRGIGADYTYSQAATLSGAGFMAAFEVDAKAIEDKFPNKYEYAIGQARAYAACLVYTKQV